MLLSIIVPVFDTEAYLARCLDSLLDQDLREDEYEVLVIDDGSRDGSRAIADAYAAAHPAVSVHGQANLGVSAARNAGLRLALGRYVYFVDSDDHVAPRSLGWIARSMIRDDLQVAALGWTTAKPGQAVPRPMPETAAPSHVMTGVQYIAEHGYVVGVWSYMFERRFLQAARSSFEEGRVLESLVFTTAVLSAAERLVFVPVRVYRYVERPGSIMERRDTAHTERVMADWEHAIEGLDRLRRGHASSPDVPEAYLGRLAAKEQKYIFFFIARFIRSDIPLRPGLVDALERFGAMGMYPLSAFPIEDYSGRSIRRVLLGIFNRPCMLLPLAVGVRLGEQGLRWAKAISHRYGLHVRH